MHHSGEQEVIRCLNTQQVLSYLKMTAAADRQKLGQSLYKS